MKALVVSAHPDDETIFFGGLILQNPQVDWKIICVTDAGSMRARQLEAAAERLGVKEIEVLGFEDIYDQRLDVKTLQARLESEPKFDRVFTHSILGEYGHPHHQDVSFAVHEAMAKHSLVYSVAYNICPQLTVTLCQSEYEKKTAILWNIYRDEVSRFVSLLPATAVEGFSRLAREEIVALYDFLSGRASLDTHAVRHHRWMIPFIQDGGVPRLGEKFFSIYFAATETMKQVKSSRQFGTGIEIPRAKESVFTA